ncbi:hypothetical protein DA717_15695 [Piscirickettsiaceae bacterium NZ-RLO2]|uniref:hypothetical protein n=1 Tax=Piscirickettsia salmonis TaxID=1238 RepID=UPI000F08BE13|nr:hypothetical protein DA717_15695 [Piscirickettsiaceae bacterium NZ-RLO2]
MYYFKGGLPIQSAEGQFNSMGRLGKILADIKSTCIGFNKSLEKASPQAKSDFKLAGELIEELDERLDGHCCEKI